MKMNKRGILVVLIFLIGFAFAGSFADNSQSEFDEGIYLNTTWDGESVVLFGENLTGAYLSQVFDGNKKVSWNFFDWMTTPYESYEKIIFYPTYVEDEYGGDITSAVEDLGGSTTWERVEVQSWDSSLGSADVIKNVFGYCHTFYYDSGAYVGFQISVDNGTSWSNEKCLQPVIGDKTVYNCDLTENFEIDEISELNNLYLRCTFPNASQGNYYSIDWTHLLVYYNSSLLWNNSGENLKRNSYFFGVDGGGDVFNSNDTGFLWRQTEDNFGRTTDTKDIFSYGNYIYIISNANQEVWRSDDFGVSFSVVNNSFADSSLVLGEADLEGNLFVVDSSGDVYESQDDGEAWILKGDFNGGATNNALGIAINSSGSIFIVDGSGDVYVSEDAAVSWTKVNDGYGGSTGTDGMVVDSSGNLYILLNYDVYESTDYGVSWTKVNDDFTPYSNAGCSIGSDSFGGIYVVDCIGRFFKSSDGGVNWVEHGDLNGPDSNDPKGITEYSIFTDLEFQVRNCSLPDCSDGVFVGPDNTSSTFFTSLDNSFEKYSRFFQYKGFFSTQGTFFSPEIYNVSLNYFNLEENSPEISFDSETTEEGSYNSFEQDWANVGIDLSDESQIYSFINFNNSLVGFWKMNETSGGIIDYSGEGNDGVNYGAISAEGKFGNALYFDGVNDYVDISRDDFDFPLAPYTVSLWVKENEIPSTNQKIIGTYYNKEFLITGEVGGDLKFWAGGYNAQVFSNKSANQWHHLAMTIDSDGDRNVYVDNKVTPKGIRPLPVKSDIRFQIGSAGGYNDYFNGSIDEVLIFNRVLTEDEVSALYDAGSYSNNFTELDAGNYDFYSYVQDIYGNENQTEARSVAFLDNTAPGIFILEPTETNYSSDSLISLNYSISDFEGDLDSCWYNLNSGENISLVDCENITLDLSSGDYSLVVYANDSLDLIGIDSVDFSVVNTAPDVILVEPSQESYSVVDDIWVNYSILDLEGDLDSCWYNVGGENISIVGCLNFTLDLNVGNYDLYVYVNDSEGLLGIANESFNVVNTAPSLEIINPQEGMTFGYGEGIALNYFVEDVDGNIESCWYNLNSGENISLVNCGNTTFNVSSDGNYDLYVYANDSEGEIAFGLVEFYVDLGAPTIWLDSPAGVYLDRSENIVFTYTPEDIDLEACEFFGNFFGSWELIDVDFFPINYSANNFTLNLSDGFYKWNIRCNDSQGNSAFNGNKTFYVDTIGPSLELLGPSGTKNSRNVDLFWEVSDFTLNSCWYNVQRGENFEITNTSVNCSAGASSFSVTLDADFVLNFYANDRAGNFNFSNSSFSVDTVVVTSSSSGGGSSGGSSFSIRNYSAALPKKDLNFDGIDDFVVNNVGVKKILSWKVKNSGKSFLNDCVFRSVGDSSWISYIEKKGLASGEEYNFVFDVNIPEDVGPGEYNLQVGLFCKEENVSTSFTVEIVKKTLGFELINLERDLDERVKIDYLIEEFSGEEQEVYVEFLIFDVDGRKVAGGNQTSFINSDEKKNFQKYLTIPPGLEGELGILINFNSETYSGFIQENIVLGRTISGFTIFDRIGGTDNLISFGFIILFLVFTFFVVRGIRKHRKNAEDKTRNRIRLGRGSRFGISKEIDSKIVKGIKCHGKVSKNQARKEADLAKKFYKGNKRS